MTVKNDLAVAAFNQYWETVRNLNNERFKTMATYIAIFGAFVYAIFQYSGLDVEKNPDIGDIRLILIGFMFVMTQIVLVLTIKCEYLSKCYCQRAEGILDAFQVSELKTGRTEKLIGKISASGLYIVFYFLFLFLIIVFLIHEVFKEGVIPASIFLTIIWIFLLFYIPYCGIKRLSNAAKQCSETKVSDNH